MRIIIFLISLALLASPSCKSKDKVKTQTTDSVIPAGTTQGKVSFQYRATGCATVIQVKLENQDQPLTLIPKDTLSPTFNIDGLEILFNYRKLKMPNPKGCHVGIPAEIKDISKK